MRNLDRDRVEELQGRTFITVILLDCSTGSCREGKGVSESRRTRICKFINTFPELKSPFRMPLNFSKV